MKETKKIVLTGLMIAAGLVLPMLSRMIPNGGQLLSPMHIPALLAGIAIGPIEGMITGIACPILNNVLFGMPMGNTLIGMCVELPVYGLVTGILMKVLSEKKDGARVYTSLIIAMIVGRIVGGLVQGFVLGTEGYSLSVWASAYFIGTAPAIVIHLILIPSVYFALKKANLIK